MKLIKIILIGFLLAVALVLLAALVLPSSYQVERSVSINKAKEQVFSYLVLLKIRTISVSGWLWIRM